MDKRPFLTDHTNMSWNIYLSDRHDAKIMSIQLEIHHTGASNAFCMKACVHIWIKTNRTLIGARLAAMIYRKEPEAVSTVWQVTRSSIAPLFW